MTGEDVRALRDAYDAQLRAHVHDRLPDSVRVERDGPLLRTVGFGSRVLGAPFRIVATAAGVMEIAVILLAAG
jgi:hypothetical protein